MRRRKREKLIRLALAGLPGQQGYPSEIAALMGLDPIQTWEDMARMARRRRGVHKIPGYARHWCDPR